MGKGYNCKCDKCKSEYRLLLGRGWSNDEITLKTKKAIKKGKYGPKGKEFFEEYPGGTVNCKKIVAKCDKCKKYLTVYDLGLYVSKAGIPIDAINHIIDEKLCIKIDQLDHVCEKCGSELEIIDDFESKLSAGDIPCLNCDGIITSEYSICWD